MRKKDLILSLALLSVLCALLAPALFRPWLALGNFGDLYGYHLPLQHLTAARLQEGGLPFWNPYIFAGLPHLANPQAELFYPPAALFRVLPLVYAFTLFALLHLALAALGCQLLFRRAGLDAGAAALLAAAYALGPFLIYRIPQGIPTHVAALAWVPWCWLALLSRRSGFLGGVWALQFLGGHPQFGLVNALGMGLWAALSARRGDWVPALVREGCVAAALVAVQLAPTLEFLGRSNRFGLPEAFSAAYSMPPDALFALLRPSAAGDPLRGDFRSVPSVFFESYACYIGLIPLGLALYALRPTRARSAFAATRSAWALAALGVFLAWGRGNPLLAGWDAPLLGLSRVPARYLLWTVWGLLLAAAAALLVLDLGLWAGRFVYAQDPRPYLQPNETMVRRLGGRSVRFFTGPDIANPNKSVLYRAMNLNGYEAFYLDDFVRYAAKIEGGPAADPSRTYIRSAESPALGRLGAGYALTDAKLPYESFALAGGQRLYRIPGLHPLAYLLGSGGEKVPLRGWNPAPERWRLAGELPARGGPWRAVLAVPRYPGWRAWLDGSPAATALEDELLQSVSLAAVAPGAPFELRFAFRPPGWSWLCAAGALIWTLWLAVLAGAWSPRREARA